VDDWGQRKAIARALLAADAPLIDEDLLVATGGGLRAPAEAAPPFPLTFPDGLAPTPAPLAAPPNPQAVLPRADVLIVTWTAAEQRGLADVFTRGVGRDGWYPYRHEFDAHYRPLIRRGAPALAMGRLGSWFPVTVGGTSVIVFKSELHLNQDGIATGAGTATLPVKDLFLQLIAEARPKVVLTIGTAGAVYDSHQIGDVVVTRAAKFRLTQEFGSEPFNGKTYKSDWPIPTTHLADAKALMKTLEPRLAEPGFGPPTKRYPFPGSIIKPPANHPDIKLDGSQIPAFHPMLTTDYFEFGTSANNLDAQGAAVEMGDAALGLACAELADPPRWAIVRNISDPQINADLPTGAGPLNMQIHWAVWFYEAFGYWTSVSGALATWGIVAGLDAA
jgi:nucleoside phosphorylase